VSRVQAAKFLRKVRWHEAFLRGHTNDRIAFVRITPIISRHEGVEMAELGAGGGKGDLDQQHELEVSDTSALGMLMSLCATKMQDRPKLLSSVMEMLASIMKDPVRAIALEFAALHPEQPGEDHENITDFEEMPLESLIPALVSLAAKAGQQGDEDVTAITAMPETEPTHHSATLPQRIVSTSSALCHISITDKPRRHSPTPAILHIRNSAT
jgi:DNA cross-link repair 1C protein